MTVWSELATVLVLTLFNGVFTGAEIAMLSVRKTRLQELAGEGSGAARAALRLRRAPEALLATIQIGITVIGASTAAFGGARLEAPIAQILSGMGLGSASEGVAFALVIVLVSYLSLVIGELVPKSLALRTPERVALLVARPLVGLSALSRPVVWLLTASSNVILRPFRDRTTFLEGRLSPAELQQLVEESAVAGALHAGAGEIASRAIDLAWLKANALMVPRTEITSIDVDAAEEDVVAVLRAVPHARYPVHESTVEQVIGYVIAREVYGAIVAKRLDLRQLLRPMAFFPENAPAVDVLRSLQASNQQLGLLVDEQGGLVGLITIEDVAEDLLGEILEEDEVPRLRVWQDEAGDAIVAYGDAPLHEVARLVDVDLSGGTSATTIAGLLTERVGRVPGVGDRTMLTPHVEAEVLEANPRRVEKVRLRVRREEVSRSE